MTMSVRTLSGSPLSVKGACLCHSQKLTQTRCRFTVRLSSARDPVLQVLA